mgnify:FL=1|jgi:chemotaxis protein histidine kinase CheA
MTLQAQVYRCDSPNGPVYSQIPCDENAERLTRYDPVVKAEEAPELNAESATDSEATERQLSPMETFVTTLHNQRQQQVAEIDSNITYLKQQLNATGELAIEESNREFLESDLARLEDERTSIVEQYARLISEAESRAGPAGTVN